jgi:hypothetical protein
MSLPLDPRYYREQAARYRERAAATLDSAELQDSYVGLAVSYERLADTLEQRSLLRHSRKRSVTSACRSALVGAMIGACERQQGKCPLTA